MIITTVSIYFQNFNLWGHGCLPNSLKIFFILLPPMQLLASKVTRVPHLAFPPTLALFNGIPFFELLKTITGQLARCTVRQKKIRCVDQSNTRWQLWVDFFFGILLHVFILDSVQGSLKSICVIVVFLRWSCQSKVGPWPLSEDNHQSSKSCQKCVVMQQKMTSDHFSPALWLP